MLAFGVRAMTRLEAIFYFLAGTNSSIGSGNGSNVPKIMARGAEVDPVFKELPRELTLWQLVGLL